MVFFISEESLGSFGKKREFPFFNGFRAAISDRAWKEWRIRLKLMSRGYLYMENESDKIGFSSKAGWLFASPKNPWVRLVKKESFLFSMGFEWRYRTEHEESGENVKNSCRADTWLPPGSSWKRIDGGGLTLLSKQRRRRPEVIAIPDISKRSFTRSRENSILGYPCNRARNSK